MSHWASVALTVVAVASLIPQWGVGFGTWFEALPAETMAWAAEPTWVDQAFAVLFLAEVALLPLGMAAWWVAGRPEIRVAATRVVAVGWAPLMVFLWWDALTLGPLSAVTGLLDDALLADWLWWLGQTLLIVALHIVLLGGFARYLRGGIKPWAVLAGVSMASVATGASLAWWGLTELGVLAAEGLAPSQVQESDSVLVMLGDAFITIVAAPVVEELAFRGLLLSGLMAVTKDARIALLVSALLFGVVHSYGPEGTVLMVVHGLVFGWLYLRTGSLVAPIACHATGNSIAVIYSLLSRL